jgi:signal peptidase I
MNMEWQKLNPFFWVNKFNAWLDAKNFFLQAVILLVIIFSVRTFLFGLYWVPTGSMEPTILVGESFFADKFTPLFMPIKRGDIISFNAPHFVYSENFFIRLFQKYVYGPDNWTKRVIGIPGDRVQGKIIDGKTAIFLNGQKLDEPYVNKFPIVKVQEEAYQLSLDFNLWKSRISNNKSNLSLIEIIPFMNKAVSTKYRVYDPEFPIESSLQPFYNLAQEKLLPDAVAPIILYPGTKYPSNQISDVFDVQLAEDEYWGMGDNRLGSYDSRGFGRIKKEMIHGKILFRIFSLRSPNSLIYDIILKPLILIYEHYKNLCRSWDRWFCRIK